MEALIVGSCGGDYEDAKAEKVTPAEPSRGSRRRVLCCARAKVNMTVCADVLLERASPRLRATHYTRSTGAEGARRLFASRPRHTGQSASHNHVNVVL